jgi:putative transposase
MPRPSRINVADGTYHVTSRGNRGGEIYLDDRDRHWFLLLLDAVAVRLGWRCHAYCLMTNHYHLVVETPRANLSERMHRLNGRYARWFNFCHELEGHLFQERFHAVLVQSDAHLLELSRYLSLNPVRAGLCPAPSAWAWSSHAAMLGQVTPPAALAVDRVLGFFGPDRARARRAYSRFVGDGVVRRPAV